MGVSTAPSVSSKSLEQEKNVVITNSNTNELKGEIEALKQKKPLYNTSFYFKTAEEMRKIFKDLPEACDNTLRIAERCNVTIKLDSTSSEKYPQFPTPDGSSSFAGLLRELDPAGQWALFDFNHPLAGQKVSFEVQLIGVLPA